VPSFFFFVLKLSDIASTKYGKFQQAFGDDLCEEHTPFAGTMSSEGRTLIEDEQRSGQQSAARTGDNTAQVRELVRSAQRLTVRMTADEVDMNRETVCLIPAEELGIRKICAKMVPRNLTEHSGMRV
jgi:hypothetical protein